MKIVSIKRTKHRYSGGPSFLKRIFEDFLRTRMQNIVTIRHNLSQYLTIWNLKRRRNLKFEHCNSKSEWVMAIFLFSRWCKIAIFQKFWCTNSGERISVNFFSKGGKMWGLFSGSGTSGGFPLKVVHMLFFLGVVYRLTSHWCWVVGSVLTPLWWWYVC